MNKERIRHWFRWVKHELQSFEPYLDLLETSLRKQKRDSQAWFERGVQGKSPEVAQSYAEDFGEDWSNLTTVFPRLMFQSALVTIWSLIEHEMLRICHQDIESRFPKGPDRRKKIKSVWRMEDTQKYWVDLGVTFPASWDELLSVQEVRNQIVHDNGRRARRELNIVAEHRNEKRSDKIDAYLLARKRLKKSLKYKGDTLLITPDYCREIIASACKFFDEFLRVIPSTPRRCGEVV